MADIEILDLTDPQDTLQSAIKAQFKLTSYADDTTITLIAGMAEEVSSALYRVIDGDLAVTDSASNGSAYIYLSDDGDGTGTAELLNTVPTYDSVRGGFYSSGKKAIFFLRKNGSTYYNKTRIVDYRNLNRTIYEYYLNKEISDFTINYSGNLVSTITGTDKFGHAFTFTYTYSSNLISQVDYLIGDITYRETFTYTGGLITSTTLTVV